MGHIKMKFVINLFIVFLLPCLLMGQASVQVILAGKLLDVENGEMISDALITIDKGAIQKITDSTDKEKYKEIIDLSDYTVLPGLIDCHAHLTGNWHMDAFDPYSLPAASYGILGTVNAKKTLEAGFTSVRDLHSFFYSDIALRDAINQEWIAGPRMYVSGPGLSITGGHGAWGNWLSPQLEFEENN